MRKNNIAPNAIFIKHTEVFLWHIAHIIDTRI